jgi:hypothetical protein
MRQQRWEKRSEQLSGALWVLPLVFVVIALILGSTLSQITIRPGSPLDPFGDGTSRHRFRAEAVCPFPVIKQDDTSLDSRCGQLPRFREPRSTPHWRQGHGLARSAHTFRLEGARGSHLGIQSRVRASTRSRRNPGSGLASTTGPARDP